MIRFLKKITHPFFKIALQWYYSKPRTFVYNGIKAVVHPNVFPPHFTFSTKILLDFIKSIDLKDKTFLELGCGCGIVSLFAAKKGAKVTATDINEIALEYVKNSALTNNLNLEVKSSDLFENLNNCQFDYIVINPPYYPKNPKNIKEQAWFCGANFEYFEKLFLQLPKYINNNQVLMILSDDCNFDKINAIVNANQLQLSIIEKRKAWLETNYIYEIIEKYE